MLYLSKSETSVNSNDQRPEIDLRTGLTVVVCCYNSSLRLMPTLEHLAAQQDIQSLPVELLLIDNVSTDGTAEMAKRKWADLGAPFSMLIVYEPKPGLSHARRRAIFEARYEVLLFCDDDNWLSPEYLTKGYTLMQINPKIGLLGGQGTPVFESDPPNWFTRFQKSFALGPQHVQNGKLPEGNNLYGAGIFVRTGFFRGLFSSGLFSLLSGRSGSTPSSGEDTEWCLWCRMGGYELHYNEELTFKHFISSDRTKEKYLIRLAQEKGKSELIFFIYRDLMRGGSVQWIDSLFRWYWEIIKRLVLFFYFAVKGSTIEVRLKRARLRYSIMERIGNRKEYRKCVFTVKSFFSNPLLNPSCGRNPLQ